MIPETFSFHTKHFLKFFCSVNLNSITPIEKTYCVLPALSTGPFLLNHKICTSIFICVCCVERDRTKHQDQLPEWPQDMRFYLHMRVLCGEGWDKIFRKHCPFTIYDDAFVSCSLFCVERRKIKYQDQLRKQSNHKICTYVFICVLCGEKEGKVCSTLT